MENHRNHFSGFRRCLIPPRKQFIIKGEVVVMQDHGQSGPGKSVSIQIYSRTELDLKTGKGKLSEKAYLIQGKSQKYDGKRMIKYKIKFHVEPDFGIPGAFVIKNQQEHKFFLKSASLHTPRYQSIQFDCKSWVYPVEKTVTDRLFFSNTSYLPNHTPRALVELRKQELINLRGNGRGERKEWERIYDYDYYNDLGNPEKGPEQERPILGGSNLYPYPRRGRTGQPHSNAAQLQLDPPKETHPETTIFDIYVPPDERLSSNRLAEFMSNSFQAAVHYLTPVSECLLQGDSSSLKSFEEIPKFYSNEKSQVVDELVKEILEKRVPDILLTEVIGAIKRNPLKFQIPQIVKENEWAWKDDDEFARQMIAGTNPARIQCLQTFPPQSKHGVRSTIKPSDIEQNLEDLTLEQAMREQRIFMLDHHDYLIPFLDRINTNGTCVYASRTLLFLRNDSTLKPIAIELSEPGFSHYDEANWVYLPAGQGTEAAALWKLAKAHVAANDSAYHQLISHWLHTHAVVEPFIIATQRQLSVMHPIHRLLDPHFKDTMHINALYRSILLNADGILEKTLFPSQVSMELSSEFYKDWRFDEQGLPADLLKRHMALKDMDPENQTGVQLLFEDYPYGADGLEIWTAIKKWVKDFCSIFYADDNSVSCDEEIQAWWSEIRNVGHGDKRNETWWYQMTTRSDLIEALTTLIWISSALHASVNFGQYAYAGCPLNRPTLCRKFIPDEGTFEYAEFLKDPDKYYLETLPARLEMSLVIALTEVFSRHISDEEYLGQRPSNWTDNKEVQHKYVKFNEELREIEKRIMKRNGDPKLKNRCGPAKIPYMLMFPDTTNVRSQGGSITGKGIPNSISI